MKATASQATVVAALSIGLGLTAGVSTQGPPGPDPADPALEFEPRSPYLPRSPEAQAAGFMLPPGYRMELVAADPDVDNPVVIEFDGAGRMYVAEMISYMLDAEATDEHEPISRITRWESTRNDGVYDRRTVFADNLVAPRMILTLEDGVILTSETDSDDLLQLTDTDGDGVADRREVVFTGIGQSGDSNIEHQKAGLIWALDNWIYTDYNPFRIRWTPNGFLREPTGSNEGQWGLGMDDDGLPWFVDAGGEDGPMNFQFPIHYGGFTPCAVPRRRGGGPPPTVSEYCPPGVENGFETGFSTVWPAPGIGDMQGGLNRTRMPARNLNHFTATTGPAIFRGHRLPEDLRGDLFFTEPVGRLIRRARIDHIEGLKVLRNVYPQAEFLISADQLFRPVNISNAPDGTLYIADMYHGIIQERQWSGPGSYLRAKIEQYALDEVVGHGRIWRLRYDGRPAVTATATNRGQDAIPAIEPDWNPPRMYSETPAQLVGHFTHPNGWWRDIAQRLIVRSGDRSVVPALERMARTSDDLVARFHALWTLEGLGALDAALVGDLMADPEPRMRIQAIRASETLYKDGDKSFAEQYRAAVTHPDPNVAIQGMVTVNLFGLEDADSLIESARDASEARGVKLVAEHLLSLEPEVFDFGAEYEPTPGELTLLEQGQQVYRSLCASCHAADGLGEPLAGSTTGEMMAPSLASSTRVQGHRDYVVSVLLYGLSGPLDGETYHEVMVPMGGQSDEWVAGVASYVRNVFGNAHDTVAPADVARVRAATTDRASMWTLEELAPRIPQPVGSSGWRVTASHNDDEADRSTSLRGWRSNAPQTAGMWLQVELAGPERISEVRFESSSMPGTGGRNGGPPVYEFPRGYAVQLSMDGQTWSAPVAEGQGAGQRTTISFQPTEARFVRLTLTASGAGEAAWSVRNLRLHAVDVHAIPTTAAP